MRLLVSWVRDFVGVTAPPEDIAERLALRGFEFAGIEPAPEGVQPPWPQAAAGADAVIDFEVTANRPDCLSVLGFAREIATLYDLPLTSPASPVPLDRPVGDVPVAPVAIHLVDAERCPRYAAAMAAVTPGAVTPTWMAARLQAAGVRPISPFVDITNYVLMELGHPMHAFDADRLGGRQLVIRRAAPEERMTTLDGVERALTDTMLVIADAERAQAIAGVMGGGLSEVSTGTRSVVFESAYFQPASVRRTSKRLQLKTEASSRFERGTDINAPVAALERALALMATIGAGRPSGAIVDRYPEPREPRTIGLRRSRIALLLGLDVPEAEVVRILQSLGLTVTVTSAGWDVQVPTFRVDLLREVDLVEEVGRHYGFDKLDAAFPPMTTAAAAADPRIPRDRAVRTTLAGAGLTEAVTFGFVDQAVARQFVAPEQEAQIIGIANPLTAMFDVLRPSLLPGLVDALAHNRRHGRRDVALFEIGARFTTGTGERRGVALTWTGAAAPDHWSGSGREVDFYDVKGVVDTLCAVLRVTASWAPNRASHLVDGQAAAITVGGTLVGSAGLLLPKIAEGRGAPRQDKVFVAELDLDAIAAADAERAPGELVRPLPRYPQVVRDLSIVAAEALSADTIRGTIQAAAVGTPAPLVSVVFFDRYKGKGVAEGSVSVSVRLTFQSSERTLTDIDVQQSFERIRDALVREHGAVQR